jgi:phosphomannomutase
MKKKTRDNSTSRGMVTKVPYSKSLERIAKQYDIEYY